MEKLQITRTLDAAPAEVFAAWTQADVVARWFAPGELTADVSELDVRPGGRFRVVMQDPEGAVHTAVGIYQEVAQDTRLVFSWGWEGTPGPETKVTVELAPRGSGTELVLTHDGFPSAAMRDRHVHGWTGSTAKLEALFAAAPAES